MTIMYGAMESAKGKGHVRNALIGLVALRALYEVVNRGGWSDGDGLETLTNEAEGLETLANEEVEVDEGECLESKMFEMWNKEAEAERDLLRKVEAHPEFSEGRSKDGSAIGMDQHIAQLQEDFSSVLERLNSSARAPSSPDALRGGAAAADAERARRRQERQAEFDRLFEETQKAIRERKSSVPQWSDLRSELQGKYDSTAAARRQAARAHQKEFDQLYQNAQAHLNTEGSTSSWAKELARSQARMQQRLQQLHDAHAGHAAAAPSSKLRGAQQAQVEGGGASSWAKELMDMQAKMQYQLEHLHDHHHHHHHVGGGEAAASKGPPTAWAQGLLDMQAKMQNELDHLHDHHHHHLHQGAASSQSSAWAQGLMDMQAKMQYQLDHLHDHMHHSHHHVEAAAEAAPQQQAAGRLRGARPDAASATPTGEPAAALEPAAAGLEWLPVRSWKERASKRGVQSLTLTRDSLHSMAWKGRAPNVSCIMALPASTTAQFHFMYAVNNFKLQHYDGDSELVVVYHHDDAEGASLVRKYTQEGARVRGVASRDDAGDFPSTMAFRYAAWTSNAEVVAQWDFEAYHHPERLSMQVRALAASGRPGSLLLDAGQQPASPGAPGRGREGSLVGEAAWMRQHWHPLLDEEHGVLELAQAHNVVLVDSPAYLYGTGAASHAHAGGSAEAPDELELRGIEACRASSGGAAAGAAAAAGAPDPLEQALVDAEAGDAIQRLLEKRGDIAAKFGTLCAEAEAEVDPKKRSFLHHHAGQMDTVREQLDEHFSKVQVMLEVA